MTKDEGAIIMAYTGYIFGDMTTFHAYAEKLLKRPVFIHEFGNEYLLNELKKKSKDDFIKLSLSIKNQNIV